jgi:hypothetical protein
VILHRDQIISYVTEAGLTSCHANLLISVPQGIPPSGRLKPDQL